MLSFVFDGIDTYAEVKLNGEKLFFADNQFRVWKHEVKDLLKKKDNLLEVHFLRYDSTQLALYEQHQPRLPEKYAVTRKAPYQHGWDWAPKYKNVGIWKRVELIGWSDAKLQDAYILTENIDNEKATMRLCLDVESKAEGNYVAEIYVNGEKNSQKNIHLNGGTQNEILNFEIENPELWWPNEMGEQPLYVFDVLLKDGDKVLDFKKIWSGIKTFEIILNYRGTGSMKGARVYVTLFPCNECAKAIIQSGIKEVIYISDKYADTESTIASKKMFNMTGVKYRQYEPAERDITLSI